MPIKTSYSQIPAYVTKDGSLIRELMHPSVHGNMQISLAEAIIPAGATTHLHRHPQSEELYHIKAGMGIMTLGAERFPVQPGDTVAIAPGTPHQIHNHHSEQLEILCCCAPPYSHEDTELLDAV
jgi:mannose-6-phosphate isomerase-like protein (cupin superfamily)